MRLAIQPMSPTQQHSTEQMFLTESPGPSQSTVFEDARSDSIGKHLDEEKSSSTTEVMMSSEVGEGTDELDRLLSESMELPESDFESPSTTLPPSGPPLSPAEIEFSKRIRRKYGLGPDGEGMDREAIMATGVLASGGRKDSIYSACTETTPSSPGASKESLMRETAGLMNGRQPSREVMIIFGTARLLVKRFVEEMISTGMVVENEHPLLEPLCAILEIALHHGWRRGTQHGILFGRHPSLWDLIRRADRWTGSAAGRAAIENVRQFSTLQSSTPRVRAWIRLALMNKCLAPDLTALINHEGAFVVGCYEEWACVRSDSFQPLLALIASMDAIDFNLYIKEQDIPQNSFTTNWSALFANGRINFDALIPPVHLGIELLQLPSSSSNTELDMGVSNYEGATASAGVEGRLEGLARQLREENARLRRALVSQINQRAYFQDEYSKIQSRCAALLSEAHQNGIRINVLETRLREMTQMVEAHEQTNEALQRQLADAYSPETLSGDLSDPRLYRQLREMVERLGGQLEEEQQAKTHLLARIAELEGQKSKTAALHEQEISELQAQFNVIEEDLRDRLAVLQDQVNLANNLKDEYKRRLKADCQCKVSQ